MHRYFEIIAPIPEYPAVVGTENLKECFRFAVPYARHSYYTARDLLYSRQRYGNDQFLLELIQCLSWRQLPTGFHLKDRHPALIFMMDGRFHFSSNGRADGLLIGECFLVLLTAGEYAAWLDRAKSKILFLGINAAWFIEHFGQHPDFKTFVSAMKEDAYFAMQHCHIGFGLWRKIFELLRFTPLHKDDLDHYLEKNISHAIELYAQQLQRQRLQISERFNQIAGFVLDHIKRRRNLPLINDIAFEFGLGERTLQRHCKEITGQNVNQYINTIRMEEAYRLLSKRQSNVNKIANLLIFKSRKYFISEFKKRYSVHPAEISRKESR